MAYVAQMSGLETLKVNYTMGDAGLAHLNVMPNLDDLDLTGSKVTDAGLATLIGLPKLRALGLAHTRVTAAGVAHLRGMRSLKVIDVNYTAITGQEVWNLKRSGVPVSENLGSSYPSWTH